MKNTLIALSLLALSLSAQAGTWQEIDSMDTFCNLQVNKVLELQQMPSKGQKITKEVILDLITPNTGAIMEKMIDDLKENPTISPELLARRSYAMCMDNARHVLLEAKRGRRTPIEDLR